MFSLKKFKFRVCSGFRSEAKKNKIRNLNKLFDVNNQKCNANLDLDLYHKGIFPCFFLGKLATLFSNIAKALINFRRVCLG